MSTPEIVPVTPDDDWFHPVSDHPYETETFWVSFHHPERELGGWFYNQVLFNQGDLQRWRVGVGRVARRRAPRGRTTATCR